MSDIVVRTCPRCHEPKVVPVRHWGTRVFFGLVATGSTSRVDWRCQGCGRGFAVHSAPMVRFVVGGFIGLQLALIGGLLLAASVAGLANGDFGMAVGMGAFASAIGAGGVAMMVHFGSGQVNLWRNPVAAGAGVPVIKYAEAEPARRCTCGAAAPVTKVTASSTNRIPTGTDYQHTCPSCGTVFEVSDVWGLMFAGFAALFFGTLTAFVVAVPPGGHERFDWNNLLCMGLGGLPALIAAWMSLWGAVKRWNRHPLVDDSPRAA